MILIERDIERPAAVEVVRKEVLLCLQTAHDLHTYESVSDLIGYLDANLAAAGMTGLLRVVLFYKTPQARIEVERRMDPGGTLNTFSVPSCWMALKASLPEMRKRADQLEPGWVLAKMKEETTT